MKSFYLLLISIFFLHTGIVNAQIIRGTVQDDLGNPIVYSTIIVKQTDSTGVMLAYTLAREGAFALALDSFPQQLSIEVRAVGFQPAYQRLSVALSDTLLYTTFKLSKIDTKELEEVTVKAKKFAFEKRGDTTVYNVASYLDTETSTVEDLLKKLPGVEVDKQTGAVKYKGKAVETVLLDGDNLFGNNYTKGTQNVGVDILEAVEAIEHFSENPLLKGIESSNKVALNLKLKEGKVDISGNVSAGGALDVNKEGRYFANASVVSVSKTHKSFGNVTANNIGKDAKPLEYSAFGQLAEQYQERRFLATEPVTSSFSSPLSGERSNLNQQWALNGNSLIKLGKKASVRFTLYGIEDRQKAWHTNRSENSIQEQQFVWSNTLQLVNQPHLYRGDIVFKWNTSENSLLAYDGKVRTQQNNLATNIVVDDRQEFTSNVLSTNHFGKHRITYTHRLASNKALQSQLVLARNTVNQTYQLNPSILDTLRFANDTQTVHQQKTVVESTTKLLISSGAYKAQHTVGFNHSANTLNSQAQSTIVQKTTDTTYHINRVNFLQYSAFHQANHQLILGKWYVGGRYALRYLNQVRKDQVTPTERQSTHWIFEPSLFIQYTLSEISSVMWQVGYLQSNLLEEHLHTQPILTNNRSYESHNPVLSLQETYLSSLLFQSIDLFNQFQFSTSVGIRRHKRNYFRQLRVTPEITSTHFVFLDQFADELRANIALKKFIDVINCTLELKSSTSYTSYLNFVNDTDLRKNENILYDGSFTLRTGFLGTFNAGYTLRYIHSVGKTDIGDRFQNTNSVHSITAKKTFPKQWKLEVSADYFIPSHAVPYNTLLFLNAELAYNTPNKIWNLSIRAHNLTNETVFERIAVNDFSQSSFQFNLLPRYVGFFLSRKI